MPISVQNSTPNTLQSDRHESRRLALPRRLEAKVQAQVKIQREAARRLAALGGTMPDLEDIRRRRADEDGWIT
jgi:hypothetical protein